MFFEIPLPVTISILGAIDETFVFDTVVVDAEMGPPKTWDNFYFFFDEIYKPRKLEKAISKI